MKKTSVKKRLAGKKREVFVLLLLACLLAFAVWKIFYGGEVETAAVSGSEEERALATLLSEIDGAGEVSVMICQDENGVNGVVIVCEGAQDIRVHTSVKEAAATALGTDEKNVKIYLKKNERR